MSVADSILSIDLHTEGGIAYGSAVKLLGQSATDTNFTGYCRYSIRMRALTAGVAFGQVSRYGMANMLINNNNWPEWGEHDWPERKLDSVAMGGFYHPAQATNTSIGVLAPTGTRFADWHTWTIEWFPEGAGARIRWFCDDTLCYDTSAFVITAPPAVHGALIQAASNGGVPTPGETARLEIDWVALHTYSP